MTNTADHAPVDPTDEFPSLGQAGADPYSIPLEKIDPCDPELFESNTLWGYFERLRKEAPVHFCADGLHSALYTV